MGGNEYDEAAAELARRYLEEGREIFRFDTFGSEDFWGGQLKLHQAIAGEANGGVGPGVSPETALELGLKVDINAIPADVAEALGRGEVDLADPASTLVLLKANAVVGVTGFFSTTERPSPRSASNARYATRPSMTPTLRGSATASMAGPTATSMSERSSRRRPT